MRTVTQQGRGWGLSALMSNKLPVDASGSFEQRGCSRSEQVSASQRVLTRGTLVISIVTAKAKQVSLSLSLPQHASSFATSCPMEGCP